jgi:hypothetical protein
VQKLRKQKDAYLQGLAIKTNAMIQSQIVSRMGLGYLARYTVDDVIEILNPIILRNFLEIQSGVIAYGLHKQLMDNYELGLSNLKTLMNTKMSKDKRPNFSNIGLSDEEIEKLSMEIGSYSKEHESIENKIIK